MGGLAVATPWAEAVATTCPYCGVGCGVLAETAADGAVSVRGDPTHPANFGRLCSKGTALGQTLGLEGRLLHPRIGQRQASWHEATALVAAHLTDTLQRRGPNSIGLYVSGQLLTEDYYVANKFAKGFLGTGNIDTNSRLCMASAVSAMKRAFGADHVPCTYEDVEEARLVVLVGANLAWCHPVLYQRLDAAKRRDPGKRVIVIDPRRTATCGIADLHLRLAPGTDGWLFAGLLAFLAANEQLAGGFIARHTNGLGAAVAAATAAAPTAAATAEACGLETADVATFFGLFADEPQTVTLFSQGINQSSSGTDKGNAIINVHLATGRIGRPGAGPFSITGQPNAMGGREVGGMASTLAAHVDYGDPEASIVEAFWGGRRLPEGPGLKAVQMFEAVADGRIEVLWIMATNPAASLPDADLVKAAIARCPCVIVSDCIERTDTAELAHIHLPAAAWGEKDGTVTNSERRISRQRAFRAAPGEARPDWWIVSAVARGMGFGPAFDYAGPAEIFREHAKLATAVGKDLDLQRVSELSEADYEALAPVQWPVGRATRSFADGRFLTRDGRAGFVAVVPQAPAAAVSLEFPLILLTGRYRDQWHTMTRTGRAPALARHLPEPLLDIHPDDAAAYALSDGGLATTRSRHGAAILRVRVTPDQRPGTLFAPIHWTGQASGHARIGALLAAVTDPVSGQPELKATPVDVQPLEQAWSGFIVGRALEPPVEAVYWTRIAFAGGTGFALAGARAPTDWQALARRLIGEGGDWLEFEDTGAIRYRAARMVGGRLEAAIFIGDEVARDWLAEQLLASETDAQLRADLLAGRSGGPAPGPVVCACFGVGRDTILGAIRTGQLMSAEAVGAALKAGTNCGSCLPEIRTLLQTAQPSVVA